MRTQIIGPKPIEFYDNFDFICQRPSVTINRCNRLLSIIQLHKRASVIRGSIMLLYALLSRLLGWKLCDDWWVKRLPFIDYYQKLAMRYTWCEWTGNIISLMVLVTLEYISFCKLMFQRLWKWFCILFWLLSKVH